MFGETTISYVKIWFIIQLKVPFINEWPSGPRWLSDFCFFGDVKLHHRVEVMYSLHQKPKGYMSLGRITVRYACIEHGDIPLLCPVSLPEGILIFSNGMFT